MRKDLGRYEPRPLADCPRKIDILLADGVFSHILREMNKHVNAEEGGKYIGYLFKPGHVITGGVVSNPRAHRLLVTDFLPSGPKAIRTAVEFHPDGEYQERLFRQLEATDASIEHLGTWHSHHCNGLLTLSRGDVDGYFRTIEKPAFRLDFFLASLVKRIPLDISEPGWIDHYLFVRGLESYYAVTDHVKIVKLPFPTSRESEQPHQRGTRKTSRPNPPLRDSAIAVQWYETEEGRRVLKEDRGLFGERFNGKVVATRRGSQITLTGHLGRAAISLTYPASPDEQRITALVNGDGTTVLEISCDLEHRNIAIAAALTAAEALQAGGQ